MSRIHPKKGIDFLLRAWASLGKANADWELTIVGPDELQHRAQMQRLAGELGLTDVLWLDAVHGQDKSELYRSADLFVLPTHAENFGLVVAEALAHEVPVITTRNAPWEGLEKHRCGWWIDLLDDPLVAALSEGISLPDLDKDLHNIIVKADRARDSILSLYTLHFFPEFSKKPSLDEYEAAIQDKLSSQPEIKAGWDDTKKILSLIRDIRNASEHRRHGNQLKLNDFEMQPNGSVSSPIVEIEHKNTPIEPVSILDFLDFIGNAILDHAEGSIVTIRLAALLDKNPFKEHVCFLPPENRRHPLVRYCRAINLNEEMRILG